MQIKNGVIEKAVNLTNFLAPLHMKDLKNSGLSDDTILESGIKSVCPRDIPIRLNEVTSAYRIPYPNNGGFFRLKIFPPKDKQKYYQPGGSGIHVYIPPKFNKNADTIRVTEGEKKCLMGTQEGLNVLGLGGIWSFAIKNKHRLIQDFDFIEWDSKKVEIVSDSDFSTNEKIRQAVFRLSNLLEEKGVKLSVVVIPGDRECKWGLDDFLMNYSRKDFLNLPRIDLENDVFDSVRIKEISRNKIPPGFLEGGEIGGEQKVKIDKKDTKLTKLEEEGSSKKDTKLEWETPRWCSGMDYSKVPLVPRPPRTERKEPISFRTMPRLIRLCQIIREDKPLSCYKTLSDVYHHAFYLGLQLIYNRGYKNNVEPEKGRSLRELILKNEQFVEDSLFLEDTISIFAKMEDRYRKGYMKLEELQKSADELIESTPEHLRQDVQEELNLILMNAQRKGLKRGQKFGV